MTQQEEEQQQPAIDAEAADLVARICFERLPLAQQALTVGCLSRAWRLWATPLREALRREITAAGGALLCGHDVPD